VNNYIIEAKGLSKHFGAKQALNNFNLSIKDGGIHALIGSNGAGKSTLFRILLGIEHPSCGSSHLLGLNSQALTASVREKVGYVNEEHTLPLWMTSKELIKMQSELYSNWHQDTFYKVISNFNVDLSQKISGLSRGERAGLNLSMALAQSPELLILDEPTLGLDVVAKHEFLEALMFAETNIKPTVIYCSHQMDEIERVAEQLIIVEKGHVIIQQEPDDFCSRVGFWIVDTQVHDIDFLQLEEILTVKVIENQFHLATLDARDGFAQILKNLGADSVVTSPTTLEKAITALLSKNHAKYQAPQEVTDNV